jgi:uncharacterized integral membrane protein
VIENISIVNNYRSRFRRILGSFPSKTCCECCATNQLANTAFQWEVSMYLRTILIVLVLGALALFAAANWHAFTTPTTLSLIVTTVEAPLGLILIGIVVLLTALFLIYLVYLQSSVLLETRRHAHELHAQRELAEHAEISRIHELQVSLETQLNALAKQNETAKAEMATRLSEVEGDLRQSVEQCQNSLAAAIAEIDDRLTRGIGQSAPRKLA